MEISNSKSFITDKDIIGPLLHPSDTNNSLYNGSELLTWLVPIAEAVQPRSICEIGTRYGYTVKALLEGCSPLPEKFVGYDMSNPHNQYLREKLAPLFPSVDFTFLNHDTRRMDSLGYGPFDLVSVDGERNSEVRYHHMCLGWNALAEGGCLLVPNLHESGVFDAWKEFMRELGGYGFYVPTLTGLGLLQKD